ncbi:hypothetical protein EBZU44_26820 [Enterobacter cloacae]|nr:hypothetical protein EBZU44_26820 [Enterobacter cloacae]
MTRVQLFQLWAGYVSAGDFRANEPCCGEFRLHLWYLKQGGMNPANKMLIEIDLEEASSDDLAEHLKVLIALWQST